MLSKRNTLQVKGVAILMMMTYHLWGCPEKYTEAHPLWFGHPITKALVLCVPIYLFLSGYGLQCGGRMGIRKLYNRLRKLYSAFWWVFVPFVSIGMFIGYYDTPASLSSFVYNFFGLTYEYNAEWWFFCIYLGQLFTFLILGRLNLKGLTYTILMIVIFAITRVLLKNTEPGFFVKMFLIYINIFMLGCFASKYDIYKKLDELISNKPLANILIATFGILFALLVRAYAPIVGIAELICVPMLVYSVYRLVEVLPSVGKVLCFFGEHSTNLWLIHSFFIFYYLKNITFLTSNPFLMLAFVIVQALFCSILLNGIKRIPHIVFS